MLTPSGCTLAAQSASRRVVSLAAWMPLSVNCTKLMYVGMTLLLQVIPESVSADEGSAWRRTLIGRFACVVLFASRLGDLELPDGLAEAMGDGIGPTGLLAVHLLPEVG